MDAILTVENLTKQFGEKLLFKDISFGIGEGQKTALIARNGYGKSTLLNIIIGKELQDGGFVTLRGGCRMSYLPQTLPLLPGQKVRDFVFSDLDKPENMETWDYEQRVTEVLSRLKVYDLERDLRTLSGGEQKKVALARILIDDADLLLLDEPTNHLDLNMIEWLERFLAKQRLSILMVTHDRYFLDNVCQDILELDNARLYHYDGTYHYYLDKKAEREHNERAGVTRAKSLYRTELEWMRRMPRARGTKARARIDAFYDLEEKAHTRCEGEKPELSVKTERIGGKILELYNISKSYDNKKMVDDFSYVFRKGEKVGIVGPNGIGKSTFLDIITERIKPDNGRVVVGQTIRFGLYTQGGLRVKNNMRVLDIVKEVAEVIELESGRKMTAHQFLSYFGFDDTTQYNYFGNLSGGERRRLYLLKILMANPNFLILDEPTNDLDIYTLEILERFLAGYKGCLIIVSHDRSFMDNIVDHLFVFLGEGKIRDYPSNYTQYRGEMAQRDKDASRQRKTQNAEQQKEQRNRRKTQTSQRRASFLEKKEYETLTAELEALNQEKATLEQLLSNGEERGPNTITAASIRIGEINVLLDTKELRWLELDDLIN